MTSTPLSITLSDEALEQIAQRAAEILAERQHDRAVSQRWLTVDQAAAYIGAKRQRIYDLRSAGRLSRNGDGRRGLVDRHELDRLVGGMRAKS
jgi:excisionase family DNA binding protein